MSELLAAIARDGKAPQSARVAAARAVIEYESGNARTPGEKSAAEMTEQELDDAIAAAQTPGRARRSDQE